MTDTNPFIKGYLKCLMAIFILFVIFIAIGILVNRYANQNSDFDYNTFTGNYYHHHIKGDVRCLVPNVNQNLARLIPKDVHYVSYHPKQDKAVYCYYPSDKTSVQENIHHLSIKPFSRCYFIKLTEDRIQTDDITDLIRVNLQIYYKNSSSSFNKHLYADNPYVEGWIDRGDLLYGMYFVVNPEFNRFGSGDYY